MATNITSDSKESHQNCFWWFLFLSPSSPGAFWHFLNAEPDQDEGDTSNPYQDICGEDIEWEGIKRTILTRKPKGSLRPMRPMLRNLDEE